MANKDIETPEDRARRRAKYLTGVLWHLGAFFIINGFFWILDLTIGADGLQWAYWITGVWGIGLLFHLLAYFVDGRQVEERKAQQYLAEERTREEQLHR